MFTASTLKKKALVFQGGGALGAYDTGVFQALYEKIGQKEGFDKLFDTVAGTSSGAINAVLGEIVALFGRSNFYQFGGH